VRDLHQEQTDLLWLQTRNRVCESHSGKWAHNDIHNIHGFLSAEKEGLFGGIGELGQGRWGFAFRKEERKKEPLPETGALLASFSDAGEYATSFNVSQVYRRISGLSNS